MQTRIEGMKVKTVSNTTIDQELVAPDPIPVIEIPAGGCGGRATPKSGIIDALAAAVRQINAHNIIGRNLTIRAPRME
jgi:hypothetical protein